MSNMIHNQLGHALISQVDVIELASKYQTPLYIMDEERIRNQCRLFLKSFKSKVLNTEVIYAGKAFLTKHMAQLVAEEGLSLDVVSYGELYTAIKSGIDPKKIFFHGNNKSKEELIYAVKIGVGVIVVDNPYEYALLENIESKQYPKLLLRINPGIEAHTHEYIKTTHHNSKFGLSIYSQEVKALIKQISDSTQYDFLGFHSHIGSQIFDVDSFIDHTKTVLDFANQIEKDLKIPIEMINIGGGFGAKYTENDKVLDPAYILPLIISTVETYVKQKALSLKRLAIEPGRSIVAEAGYTLYKVGAIKQTFGGKRYVFIDGSMADHMRTALYQALYYASLANRVDQNETQIYSIAGKACESGDIIIHEARMPILKPDDYILVHTTGAYHYSMASNYNRLLKPAVVFVNKGSERLVVKRETYDDLIRHDL